MGEADCSFQRQKGPNVFLTTYTSQASQSLRHRNGFFFNNQITVGFETRGSDRVLFGAHAAG